MSVSFEPDGPGWRLLAIGAWTVVTALFGWIANSLRAEQRDHALRLRRLEDTYISREELDRHLTLLRADNLRMNQEGRAETLRLHAGNLVYLQRIEDKIDRGSQTRHETLDGVGAIQLMLRDALRKIQQEDGTS